MPGPWTLADIGRALSPPRLRGLWQPGLQGPQANVADPPGIPQQECTQGPPPPGEHDGPQDAHPEPQEVHVPYEAPRVLVPGTVIADGLVVPPPPAGPYPEHVMEPPGPPPVPRPEGLDNEGRPLPGPLRQEPALTSEAASGSNATHVHRAPHYAEIHWWDKRVEEPQEPVPRSQLEEQRGPQRGNWMSLEWMRYLKDPYFEWFEWHHKKGPPQGPH